MHVGIREHISFVLPELFAAELLGRFDKVVDAARVVAALELVDAVGNPVHDQRFHPVIPQRAVDGPCAHVHHFVWCGGRGHLGFHGQRRCRGGTIGFGSELDDVDACFTERRGGRQRAFIRERHCAGA